MRATRAMSVEGKKMTPEQRRLCGGDEFIEYVF